MKCDKCNGTEFYQTVNRNKPRFSCKNCMKNRAKQYRISHKERLNEQDRERGKMPHRIIQNQARFLKSKYNLTLDQYRAMRLEQNEKCAVCNQVFDDDNRHKTCHVDHDHKTGKIRGLLCCECNLAIGKMKDSPELLEKAAKYLEDAHKRTRYRSANVGGSGFVF
jgi:hypothetical protein